MTTPDDATDPVEVVETLATALDEDDYDTARSVLDPEVVYEIGGNTLIGPDAVVDSYRKSSELAHQLFDEVAYDHEILGTDEGAAFRVRYRDLLTAGGETHAHFAEQEVTLGRHWVVVKIVDRPMPAEREKLEEFMARHGISRPES